MSDHGFANSYQSVKRFVGKLRGSQGPQAAGIIQTGPGEEAQVDYGTGPMVRDPKTGKYRRTRLFVMTLGYSRKSVRLLTFKSSSHIWAELHETAFRRLGGSPRYIILDNLREGVISLAKKYGVPAVEDASAAALELHVYQCRFVRRYLERKPPVTLRQVDPLIRELTQYRDLINLKIQEQEKS